MATNNANSSTKEYQVLQKYYSKLIRTIADPVRIAADLFSANLISEETRIKANNENSNLDTRNSYLLDGLTRAVAIDPTNLTKIISVLECHPPLLSLIAEEMKTECGLAIANPSYLQAQLQSMSLDDVEEIGKKLGHGAYGVVYEVKMSGLVCAGKTVHECFTIQNETLDKFVEECLCHSQQRHPNIVQLMGVHFSRHSRLPMLVMEYLPLSLTQCLETRQDLPLQMKYSIFLDVAKGLNYLHCKRPPIVHRDLTANNILLTSNFIAKISDLGVSRMANTFKLQQLTKAPGNQNMMPPEALEDNPSYDHKLDVFSYGCLILHVFTHQWPEPTAQYKQNDLKLFVLVTEWDRRAKYTTAISSDNPFFSFAKSCLENDPKKRPTMSDAIICAEDAVSSLPPLKSQLELMKDISSLTEQMNSLTEQKDQLVRQMKEDAQKLEDKVKCLEEDKHQIMNDLIKSWQVKAMADVCLAAQEKEITKKSNALDQEVSRTSKLEEEILSLNEKLSLSITAETEAKKELRQKEAELQEKKIKLSISIEENAQLQSKITHLQSENACSLSSLQESHDQLQLLLKSKDDTIEVLRAQCKSIGPSYQVQNKMIKHLLMQELKDRDEWYLVDTKWFKKWKRYVRYDSDQFTADDEDHPGPVNNANLFTDIKSQTLKDDLKEDVHYALLPEPVWDLLVSWYGLSVGSRPIRGYGIHMTYINSLKKIQGDTNSYGALTINGGDIQNKSLVKVCKIIEKGTCFMHFLEKLGHAKYFSQKLTTQDALTIRNIEPDHGSGTLDSHKLLYLILEKLMMFNYECRKVFLYEQFNDEDDKKDDEESSFQIAVHPMDSLFALIHCADDFLRQDLYSKLSSCQLAVPLLLPDPVSDTIVFPLWAMYSIIKQWKCQVPGSETESTFEVCDSRVVDCQAPLISFIRFHRPYKCSKSKILNSVISDLKHDFFFNHKCEGSSVTRQFVDGLVEACWYFPTGEKSDIFSNVITFANLRGNASKHTQQLNFLISQSDMLFVFLNEEDITFRNLEKFSQSSFHGRVIFILHACSNVAKWELKKSVPDCTVLMLDKKTAGIVRSIRLQIEKRLCESQMHLCQLSQCLTLSNKHCIKIDVDNPFCKQGKVLAKDIMKELNGIPAVEVKEIMVPLQGPNLWHEWAKFDKKQYHNKWEDSDFLGVEGFNSEMRKHKKVIRKQQFEKTKNLSVMMKKFIKVLLHEPMEIRKYFLQWLKFHFDDSSHENLSQLQTQYEITRGLLLSKDIDQAYVVEVLRKLQEQAKHLINASFGLEHLFREFAQLYESTMEMKSQVNEERLTHIKILPKVAAELLMSGHPLEIIDGDVAHIPLLWVTAVLEELNQLTNNSTIFILSVLGIQSTGKSTLLNTLFGVRFPVSAGRCTRGAYFQLLKLDDKLSTETKCDYVLVIDTEGLRAPELSDQDTQQHDNELAALVIGLASVTIINIFGEVPADINGILQTTVHALKRMKKVELKPSCQFVKHHVANVSANKTNKSKEQFRAKLDRIAAHIQKADYEDPYVDFNDIITFNNETGVDDFPSLWEGNPPMAPVNPAYCEAAVKLKSKFVGLLEHAGFLYSIDEFKKRVTLLWNTILKDNFIFSFKNTLEMEVYSCVDAEYNQWSWKLQKLVLKWENKTQNRITSSDNSIVKKIEQEQIDMIHQQLDDKYNEVMGKLKFFFESLKWSLAPTMAKWQVDYETKLRNVRDHHKDAAEKFCQATIRNKHAKSKLQHLQNDKRTHVTTLVKDLVSQMDITKDRKLTSEDHRFLKETFDRKWNEWMQELYKEHPLPEEQNISNQILNCLRRELKFNDQLIHSKVNEISLEQRGHLQLNIDTKQHLKFHAKSNKWLKAVKHHILSTEKDLALAKQITACWLSEAESFLDKQNSCYNDLLVISVVQDLTTKIGTFEAKPEVTFKFTLDYRIDIILEVVGYALRVFTKIQQDMIKDHPTTYMKLLRPTYYTIFITLCNKTAHEKAAAMCLTDLVVKHFDATLQSKLEIAIVTDIKQSNDIFYSKRALQGHILLKLIENQDFKLYETYLTNISESFLYWIRLFVEEHCRIKRGKCVITELAEKKLNQLVTTITNAAEDALRSSINIKQWLKYFHSKVSSTLPLNDQELNIVDIQEDNDLNFFTNEFLKGIQQCKEEYLASFQTPQTCRVLDMSTWGKHPAETILDTIAGCCEHCPFCKEQCEETISNHFGDHHCSLHRPQGLGGYRTSSSQIMVMDSCTELVASYGTFQHQSEHVYYDNYRQVYPRWYIPHERSWSSPYWKWFIIKYKKEIAELFNYKVELTSDTPADWECVEEADARDDIKKRFNI